jgi:hypothetical protein
MASPSAAVEPLLASSMRVVRNVTPLEDFIAAWPLLKQKSLTLPPTLTESERRLFLDLPTEEIETANIRAATNLSREQLIEKAISNRENLTESELKILQDRFWTPRVVAELHLLMESFSKAGSEGQQEFFDGWEGAAAHEEPAFKIGSMETAKRSIEGRNEKLRDAANLVLPDAPEWIQHLYQQDKENWGYICFYDAAVQQFGEERLDHFECTKDPVIRSALNYNGAKDIIDTKWTWYHYNAPKTKLGGENNYPDGAILRKAFQEILKDPQKYQEREDVTPLDTYTGHLKNGIAESGVLTNTFLLIDPICVDSVVGTGSQAETVFYENMRVLAFEADFPVPGREYKEGYQGFTWVRLDQLVYNFYELRLMKADEVGMDKIWKAAQTSDHQAFVSMDPAEAAIRTHSSGWRGFTPDSVLARRWYATRDAKAAKRMEELGG